MNINGLSIKAPPDNTNIAGLNRSNFPHFVLKCIRIEGFEVGAGTVGVDGRTGIAEQGGYLLGGVYAKTYEGIDAEFRSERLAGDMADLTLLREQLVEIIHKSRKEGKEGGVEGAIE